MDRRDLVDRHRVHLTAAAPESPLSVGNGDFCFTADCTGLQTLADWHTRASARRDERSATPLGTQSSWAFHWAPNPDGVTLADTERQYPDPAGRELSFPTAYDWRLSDEEARRLQPAGHYFWTNPQRLHLGRVAYVLRSPDTRAPVVTPGPIDDVDQTLDLWTGILTSAFSLEGRRTTTRTAVHPHRDVLAVHAASGLFAGGDARLRVSFGAVDDTFEAEERTDDPDAHRSIVELTDARTVVVRRAVDDACYVVRAHVVGASFEHTDRHALDVVPEGDGVHLVVEFTPGPSDEPLPSAAAVFAESERHWERFWRSGAVVDFSGSSDPRAGELERRVVLSQYLTAIQCAGTLPPQESGLVCNSWAGKFHLEMHWWHAAHFPMWGRPELLEPSLEWYRSILPVARRNAERNGYRGARWPKHVGPEGVESPNDIGPLLVWQQPHPVYFAELVFRARGDDPAVLEAYGDLVDETAEFLSSLLWWRDGEAHLAPPVMPAQERYEAATTWDPTFELAYVAWALGVACEWRRRRGLEVPDAWERAITGMAPLPTADGRYEAVRGQCAVIDHPSLLGALGFVPDSPLVDRDTMSTTLDWVLEAWDWRTTWGWDFPLIAMCARELGRLDLAFDTLLSPRPRNRYLANGHNFQVPNRLPLYLPGNGGLLAAIAMLVTDKTGTVVADLPDGWVVRADGFPPRP
ncbi:perphorin family protein [Jiangella asiatica]|uniref:Glycoside hydrolase family 65 n=1 Tax=Jiangella asiatica TaxID=2530372 RepID=A0A4R5D6V8_9ACTN|nr:perphorin family protein [Jiangella asiatica]TDE08337.1 hypothetical protein E1269_17685 [Jiangella asiatica]